MARDRKRTSGRTPPGRAHSAPQPALQNSLWTLPLSSSRLASAPLCHKRLTTAVFGTIFTKRGAAGRSAVDLELTPRQSDSRPRQSCACYGRRAAVARRREGSICVNCVRLKSTHMERVGEGLYDPRNEHDSCGIGFDANIKGRKSHDII